MHLWISLCEKNSEFFNSTPWEKCVPTIYQNPLWEALNEISLTMMNPNIYGRESERSNESENQIRENINECLNPESKKSRVSNLKSWILLNIEHRYRMNQNESKWSALIQLKRMRTFSDIWQILRYQPIFDIWRSLYLIDSLKYRLSGALKYRWSWDLIEEPEWRLWYPNIFKTISAAFVSNPF